MRITDLAEAIAPGVPQKIIGIREGEKVHEMMINDEDARHTLEFDDHFIIIPGIYMQNPERLEMFLAGRKGKPAREFFCYASNTNDKWLTVEDLKKLL